MLTHILAFLFGVLLTAGGLSVLGALCAESTRYQAAGVVAVLRQWAVTGKPLLTVQTGNGPLVVWCSAIANAIELQVQDEPPAFPHGPGPTIGGTT